MALRRDRIEKSTIGTLGIVVTMVLMLALGLTTVTPPPLPLVQSKRDRHPLPSSPLVGEYYCLQQKTV